MKIVVYPKHISSRIFGLFLMYKYILLYALPRFRNHIFFKKICISFEICFIPYCHSYLGNFLMLLASVNSRWSITTTNTRHELFKFNTLNDRLNYETLKMLSIKESHYLLALQNIGTTKIIGLVICMSIATNLFSPLLSCRNR